MKKQVANLKQTIATIDIIGKDSNTYAFEYGGDGASHGVRKGDNGKIYIQTFSTATSVHEITHIGQSLSNGGLVFDNRNYLQNAGRYVVDQVNMEIEAYQAQYSMNPRSMPLSITGYNKIDSFYIEKIAYPNSGIMAYPFAKKYNDILRKRY